MKKIIKSIKNEGVLKTLKKILRVIKYRIILIFKVFNKNIIKKEVDVNKFKNIIIFENNFCWNKIMKQRPQQIAENLPENTLMFYHSHEDNDYYGKKRLRKIKDNLFLIDLGYYRDILLGELAGQKNKFLMIYSTDYIPYKRIEMYQKYRYKIIYEYVDDIDEELCGKDLYKILNERHKKILKIKNAFFTCTADRLLNNIKKIVKNRAKLITNGVDYDFFKYKNYEVPEDLIAIKKKHKYVIGYYGALASWFDYELIKKLAKNKDYAIVLLGQDYDQTVEHSGIDKISNIYYLGKKDYEILPSYGCNFDIVTIPFIINQITLSTSPVKVFEYMAMQKPIVTTALPECKKYKSIFYSNNHEEFIYNIAEALKKINDDAYLKLLDEEARDNTWASKAEAIISFVGGNTNDKKDH